MGFPTENICAVSDIRVTQAKGLYHFDRTEISTLYRNSTREY